MNASRPTSSANNSNASSAHEERSILQTVELSPLRARHIEGQPTLWLPNSLDNPFRFVIEEQGTWYDPSMNSYLRWVESGNRILDIGSDPGLYAIPAAQTMGSSGRMESICLDHVSYAGLTRATQDMHWANIREGDLDAEATYIDVDVIRLGAAAIDEQGGWLARHPEILDGRPWLYIATRNGEAWETKHFDQLLHAGYQIGRYIPFLDALVPYDWSFLMKNEPYCTNVFAIPKEHLAHWVDQGRWAEPAPLERVPSSQAIADRLKNWSPPYRAFVAEYIDADHPDKDLEELALGLAIQALTAYSGSSVTERLSDWQWAIQLLMLLLEKTPTVSRLLTLARLRFEAGERTHALRHLEAAHAYFEANHTVLSADFLPPDAYWDENVPNDSLPFAIWLYAAVLDTWVKQRHLSAFALEQEGEAIWNYLQEHNALPPASVKAWTLHKKRMAAKITHD